MSFPFFAATEEHTLACARALAAVAPRAANRAVKIFLQGELGAGKTTWVRGFLHALGVTGRVRSPSFSLIEHYESGGLRVIHLDLYRLASAGDVRALGLEDDDVAGVLWLVEWPERAAGALGIADLELQLSIVAEGRQIELSTGTDLGAGWLAAAAPSLSQ